MMAGAAFGLVSCQPGPDGENNLKQFEQRSSVGFYEGGKAVYLFNKNRDQLYFNTTSNTFRIMVDEGDKYVEVAFASSIPDEGGKVNGTVTNNGYENIKNYKSVDFDVLKRSDENCWLWSSKENLGVIIFFIP